VATIQYFVHIINIVVGVLANENDIPNIWILIGDKSNNMRILNKIKIVGTYYSWNSIYVVTFIAAEAFFFILHCLDCLFGSKLDDEI